MKRDVGDIIRTLIQQQDAKDSGKATVLQSQEELTTLGVPFLRRCDNHYAVDLTNIRVFRNLHAFVQLLVDEVIEQCDTGIADVMVRHRVDSRMTPELAATGLDWIVIYVRLDTAGSLPFGYRNFGNCMQVIFRSLQTERWGGILFPDYFGIKNEHKGDAPPALLFPFHLHDPDEKNGNYFLAEYSRTGRFLRITIEDAMNSRLQLKHIPHRVVDEIVRPSYFSDIYPTAEKIHQGIIREYMNNRSEYNENPVSLNDFFVHLQSEGLPYVQNIYFNWPADKKIMRLLETNNDFSAEAGLLNILLKEIQLLDDPCALRLLAQGNIIEMISGVYRVYFDVSRYGVCLNVSFDKRRSVLTMNDYLMRMPALSHALAKQNEPMKHVRIFLIHHNTAEVIGLLQAFARAGSESMTTFFVRYSGIMPETYLETLMSLPPDNFRFYGLQKIELQQNLKGIYRFSRQFTPLDGMEEIDNIFLDENFSFLQAMRLATGNVLLKEIIKSGSKGESMLLVEDGGYLAPLMNRFCLENKTADDVFNYFHVPFPLGDKRISFAQWLEGKYLGSIEHTRNGYDYNAEVLQEFGKLQFPVASIAVSSLKRGPEARECAMSILNATETILNRLGILLSRRKIVILGSSGAIGSFLKQELLHRVEPGNLYGVDIAAADYSNREIPEFKTIEELGEEALRNTEMFIGVIGSSILKQKHIEEIILHGRQKSILFISGSTKTLEFSDLQDFLQSLCDEKNKKIGDKEINVDFNELRDLQTGIFQGYQVEISCSSDPAINKLFYLLGALMPINFLYYGIPREIVDEVMAQLFRLSCGFVKRQQSEDKLQPLLLAVDHEIDADAHSLIPGVTGRT